MRFALVVAGCLLLGCAQGSGTPAPDPAGGPARTSLRITDRSGASGPFGIGGLEYLTVQVDQAGAAPGLHPVRLDVIDPHGTMYAQLPLNLSVGSSQQASTSRVIRVRGTDIERFNLVGTWQFVATVDGAPAATASVEITE